ncbi:hypothetical protein ACR4XJ_07220 [Nitratidesulfovibrio sp. D1]|uniref:hypothetical protein n=1 Tax=Nitratidesulfovibrio sp. D1 TaxID=3440151 RepID=UPI003EBF4CF4
MNTRGLEKAGFVTVALLGLAAGAILASIFFDFGITDRYAIAGAGEIVTVSSDIFGLKAQEALFVAKLRGPISYHNGLLTPDARFKMREMLLAGMRTMASCWIHGRDLNLTVNDLSHTACCV